MKVRFNGRIKPYPFFEIRVVTEKRSVAVLGFFAMKWSTGIMLYPLAINLFSLLPKQVKASDLTPEDIEAIKDLGDIY